MWDVFIHLLEVRAHCALFCWRCHSPLTHNLTQNRKKSVEITEQRGLGSIWLWMKYLPKTLERPKPHFGAQLITRRLQVQVLSPQPKVLGFPLKSEDFPCFPALSRAVYFCGRFLTHILTHTGIRSGQGWRALKRYCPLTFSSQVLEDYFGPASVPLRINIDPAAVPPAPQSFL